MPVEIRIAFEDIVYAEKILLPQGCDFKDTNNERINFIKNLETIDLQAVPGSGKTTALMAKLLILEKYLPFEDGSGILVISHTNNAVNEIRRCIEKYCPKLFSYPNFIGTIQSFIDQFMAIPCGLNLLKIRINRVDTALYENFLWSKFQGIYWKTQYEQPGKWLWNRHIKAAKNEAKGNKNKEKEICNKLIEKEVKSLYYDYINNQIRNIYDNKIVLKDEKNKKFIGVKSVIEDVLKDGIISYDYAYILAKYYLEEYPSIIHIFQNRFRFVFVDEMQDMDNLQHDLLEKLFYDDGRSSSVYQRIGDVNQAIYSKVKADKVWHQRTKKLFLNGSHRLNSSVANIVKHFALEKIEIQGNNKESDNIKPHIIIYKDDTIDKVLYNYAEIIKRYKLQDIPRYSFKAIGWRKGVDLKFGIKNYFERYEAQTNRAEIDYDNLRSYLIVDGNKQNNSLRDIRKNILNALLKIYRLESIYINDFEDRGFLTVNKFLAFLKDKDKSLYDDFNLKVFKWCIMIYSWRIDEALNDIKAFIPDYLLLFDKAAKINKSKEFLENVDIQKVDGSIPKQEPTNVYKNGDIIINVQTVHSVKGETHTATLYLETLYQGDYESNRLAKCFKCEDHCYNKDPKKDVRNKESIKMIYVGFSRPTHLLCFAVHKDRFDKNVFEKAGWEIDDSLISMQGDKIPQS